MVERRAGGGRDDPAARHGSLSRRDELVRAIAAGMASGHWDPVMRAFDGSLLTITRLKDSLGRSDGG